MTWTFVRESAWQFALTLWHVLPWLAAMGAVFSVLSLFMPCNPGRPWWQKKNLVTDFAYWIFVPVFTSTPSLCNWRMMSSSLVFLPFSE